MMSNIKEVVFNGGPFQSYWWADEHEPVHPAIMAELEDDIDPDILTKAWENTKKVYPLIDLVPDDCDEEVVFIKSEGKSRPINSKCVLKLVSEATLKRGVSLTYYENTVTLSIYHSIVDEKGLIEIFKTLMNFYISAYAHKPVDAKNVMMEQSRRPEDYFVQNTMISPENYIPKPIKLYRDIREIFNDSKIANSEDNAVTVGEMDIPLCEYDKFCKDNGASADEMMIYVMAKTIYDMYPDERKKLSFGVMTDFRKTFGVSDSIAPCSKKMPLVLSYDEINGVDMREALEIISKTRAYQKSEDYIKSHIVLENTYSVLNIRNACMSVNFCGEFDIEDKTSYIQNITMTDYSLRSVFMIRLNDTVKVSFQYGNATADYMSAVAKTLNKFGVKAEITVNAYGIASESESPIV